MVDTEGRTLEVGQTFHIEDIPDTDVKHSGPAFVDVDTVVAQYGDSYVTFENIQEYEVTDVTDASEL